MGHPKSSWACPRCGTTHEAATVRCRCGSSKPSKASPTRGYRVGALSLLAVAVLLGAGTYWRLYGSRRSTPSAARPTEVASAANPLSAENDALRQRIKELEGELEDATNRASELRGRLERDHDEKLAASAPTLPTTLPPIPVPSPEPRSGMDAERDRAGFLIPRFERMARGVQNLEALQREYQQLCTGTIEVTDGDGNAGTVSLSATPACVRRDSEISALQAELTKEGRDIEEASRRAAVLPGILRELVAKYRLSNYLNP
jgi:hypothetical protein